jgi:hypothetical protein
MSLCVCVRAFVYVNNLLCVCLQFDKQRQKYTLNQCYNHILILNFSDKRKKNYSVFLIKTILIGRKWRMMFA